VLAETIHCKTNSANVGLFRANGCQIEIAPAKILKLVKILPKIKGTPNDHAHPKNRNRKKFNKSKNKKKLTLPPSG